jgi:hypothetical protein
MNEINYEANVLDKFVSEIREGRVIKFETYATFYYFLTNSYFPFLSERVTTYLSST